MQTITQDYFTAIRLSPPSPMTKAKRNQLREYTQLDLQSKKLLVKIRRHTLKWPTPEDDAS